jgi:hypothetical protein
MAEIKIDEKTGMFTITGKVFDSPVKSSTGKTMLLATGQDRFAYKGKVVTLAVNMHYKP